MTQLQFQPVGGPSPDDLEITSVDSYVVRVPADAPKHELAGQSIPVDGQSLAMSDLYMVRAARRGTARGKVRSM